MKGFDQINWKTKPDKSAIIHTVIALAITLAVLVICVHIAKTTLWFGWTLGSALAFAVFIGRENRDCETGLKLPSGAPSALLLMWIRPANVYDWAGPALLFLLPALYRAVG